MMKVELKSHINDRSSKSHPRQLGPPWRGLRGALPMLPCGPTPFGRHTQDINTETAQISPSPTPKAPVRIQIVLCCFYPSSLLQNHPPALGKEKKLPPLSVLPSFTWTKTTRHKEEICRACAAGRRRTRVADTDAAGRVGCLWQVSSKRGGLDGTPERERERESMSGSSRRLSPPSGHSRGV